jgi:hypothetical protein
MLAEVVDAVIGIDTHRDSHEVEIADTTGTPIATMRISNDDAGFTQLLAAVVEAAPGPRVAVSLEGSRSYGIGLARALSAAGLLVIECEQPARKQRRGKGKSDPIDAHLAVLAALRLDADRLPGPRADGDREALRILLIARQEITAVSTAQTNRLRALRSPTTIESASADPSPGSRGGAPAAGGRVRVVGPEALPAGGTVAPDLRSRGSAQVRGRLGATSGWTFQESSAQSLHRHVEVPGRYRDGVEAGQAGHVGWQGVEVKAELEPVRGHWNDVSVVGQRVCDFAAEPVPFFANSLKGTGLQQDDEMCPCFDLAEDDPLEFAAIKALDVHEYVEAVVFEVLEDQVRECPRKLAPVRDEDGAPRWVHHQFGEMAQEPVVGQPAVAGIEVNPMGQFEERLAGQQDRQDRLTLLLGPVQLAAHVPGRRRRWAHQHDHHCAGIDLVAHHALMPRGAGGDALAGQPHPQLGLPKKLHQADRVSRVLAAVADEHEPRHQQQSTSSPATPGTQLTTASTTGASPDREPSTGIGHIL